MVLRYCFDVAFQLTPAGLCLQAAKTSLMNYIMLTNWIILIAQLVVYQI